MPETTRVSGPSSPFGGLSAKVIAAVLGGILVAIVKPWGTGEPVRHAAVSAPPSAAASRVAAASLKAGQVYDPGTFGIYEPEPRWELWPAGYLTSFGFAMRLDSAPAATPQPAGSPGASVGPSHQPPSAGSGAGSVLQPAWPAAITVGAGSHLSMIGINTPLGYEVAGIRLVRLAEDGRVTDIPTLRLLSPWPRHFTVIAMADRPGGDQVESWPTGQYRLSMSIEPGGIERSIDVFVNQSGGTSVTSSGPPDLP